jgi:DUF4097 and DUF4098 domain-containing protein YvlB
MSQYEFDRSTPVAVALQMHRGEVDVTAEETAGILVEISGFDDGDAAQRGDGWTVALEDDTLVIRAPEQSGWLRRQSGKAHVVVRVPAGSSLSARMAAAELRAQGDYAMVQATLASGEAYIERVAGDVQLKAASGDLTVDRAGGSVRMSSGSGDVSIGDVTGDVSADSASGDITARSVGGSLRARTASGDIEVGRISHGEAVLQSASGDVTVGVAPGTGVWLDLNTVSGSTTSDLTMGGDGGVTAETGRLATLELRVRTVSGDIQVHRAMGELAQEVA